MQGFFILSFAKDALISWHNFLMIYLQIKEADSVQKANSAISDAGDSLNMMGALRYISSLEERDSLIQSAAEYFVNGRINLALRQ